VELSTITRSCGEFKDARIIVSTTYSDDLEVVRAVAERTGHAGGDDRGHPRHHRSGPSPLATDRWEAMLDRSPCPMSTARQRDRSRRPPAGRGSRAAPERSDA
jgi:hypothetical protein